MNEIFHKKVFNFAQKLRNIFFICSLIYEIVMFYRFNILLICFCVYNAIHAQMLQLNIFDTNENKMIFSKSVNNQIEADKLSKQFLKNYHSNGYLLADYDSIHPKTKEIIYYFDKKQMFRWVKLTKGNLEPKLYYEYFDSKKFDEKPLKYNEVIKLFEKIIQYYENNGYPFASVKLDSIIADSNTLKASILVNKYQKITIDSINIVGNLKINKKFLYRYIDIKPGSLYNERKLQQIENKLKKLPFVSIKQMPIIRITDKINKIYIFADGKNVSQFDGIIGLQPDANGKTIITGNIKIKLINNIIKNAEQLDLEWQRVQALTQNFKVFANVPYVFGTPFGLQYQITIFKKDTTFLDVQNNIGLSYYFSGINNINFFFKQRSSSLISTYGLSGITILPDYADISAQYYGTGILFNHLNNINNPSAGWNIQTNISIGNKNIKKNPNVNDMVYKNLMLHSLQVQTEGFAEKYFSKIFSKYSTIKLALKYGYIGGNATLFKNELFRIGGLKSIRGFNEQSIYANSYIIPSIEYRFIYSESGHLLLFCDGGYYTCNYVDQKLTNKIYSIGAGIQFDTKAGLFNIIYALGNNIGQSPDFRSGKIHAGLTAVF